MDSNGDFVVVWAAQGQAYSYFNGVKGQVFDSGGNKLGGEFAVNSQNVPGTGLTASNNELHPAIGMSDVGSFIVTWTAVTSQTNGVATNSIVVGREFTWDSTGAIPMLISTVNNGQTTNSNTEFVISVGSNGFISDATASANDHLPAGAFMASNAAVTMNSSGQFIVAWEAFQDNDVVEPNPDVVNSYGIYYRQYGVNGNAENRRWTNRPTKSSPRWIRRTSSRWRSRRFTTAINCARRSAWTWTAISPLPGTATDRARRRPELPKTWRPPSIKTRMASGCVPSIRRRPATPTNPATSPESRVNDTTLGAQQSAASP